MSDRRFTIPAAARHVERSIGTLYDWIRRGFLRLVPLRRGRRYLPAVEEEALADVAARMKRGRPKAGRTCFCGAPHLAHGFCRRCYDKARKARARAQASRRTA